MQTTKLANLDQTDALGTLYANAVLHLYTNPVTPTLDSVTADFTQATFSGYAAKTITAWNATYWDGDLGHGAFRSGEKQFTWTAPTPPTVPVSEDIVGWYLVDSGGLLICADRFLESVGMHGIGDAIFVEVVLVGPSAIGR